jgi:FeS assembly SUF system protein
MALGISLGVRARVRKGVVVSLRQLADWLREEEPLANGAASVHVEAQPLVQSEPVVQAPPVVEPPAAPVEVSKPPVEAAAAPAVGAEDGSVYDEVIEALQTVFDPEIPVDIYELGLIYDVDVREDASVHIKMTLTSPNCPAAQSLPDEVKAKVSALDRVDSAEVEVVFDPPWSAEMMSEEARLMLNV